MSITETIIQALEVDLAAAIKASDQAHASATDKENIPKNKYDTLALEAKNRGHPRI